MFDFRLLGLYSWTQEVTYTQILNFNQIKIKAKLNYIFSVLLMKSTLRGYLYVFSPAKCYREQVVVMVVCQDLRSATFC